MRPGERANSRVDLTVRLTGWGVCLLLVTVLARVAALQLAPSEQLRAYAKDRIASRPVQGYRGEILDRRGRLLSTSRLGFRVFVDPERLDRARLDETIIRLAEVTGEPADEVGERIVRAVSINDERRPAHAPAGRAEPRALGMIRSWLGGGGGDTPAAPTVLAAADAPDPGSGEPGESDRPLPLLRYVALGGVLTDSQVATVRALGLPGVHLERRPVREYPGGDVVASLIGKVGFENTGLMGAELALDAALEASDGTARYVRDASGRPLWIEHGQWTPATHGRAQRLALDLELQRIALEELERGVEDADAAGGRLVMMDPETGEILAMVDLYRDLGELPEFPWVDARPAPGAPEPPGYDPYDTTRYRTLAEDPGREIHPALGRNRCVEDIYEPGSTFKPFVWSLLTESGLVTPDEVFDTEGGRWRTKHGRPINDVTRRDEMTWTEVLINSSNIGMVKGSSRMGFEPLRSGLLRFGFGSKTGIGLPGETGGLVTPMSRWSHWTQESVSYGHEVAVTPVQMARAFCAFARRGEMAGTLPTVRLLAAQPGVSECDALVRALPAEVATLTRAALRQVAVKVEQNMAADPDLPEQGWRYQMFGKSGTAEIPLGGAPDGKRRPRGSTGYFDGQYNSSFVAGAPLESPRLLVVVVIDDPGPALVERRQHYGSRVAGPVARRVLERSLTYLGAEPDMVSERKSGADRAMAAR